VLAGTFPASDPPAWTPGIARPAPESASGATPDGTATEPGWDVIDVSRPTQTSPTFTQAIRSLLGAVGLVLLVPFAILALGTPVALGVRGVLAVAEWSLAFIH
jgi:hypothetical protein